MIFNTENKTHSFIEPEKDCSEFTGKHGGIVAMHYLHIPKLLVMGFDCGKVHVYSCQGSIQDSLTSQQDHYCSHLKDGATLRSLLCCLTPSTTSSGSSSSVMEVWCGTCSSSVVVWEYSLTPSLCWIRDDHVDRIESVIPVCSEAHVLSKMFTTKELKLSADLSCVVALLHQPGSHVSSLALIDVSTKSLLRCLTCNISGVCAHVCVCVCVSFKFPFQGNTYVHTCICVTCMGGSIAPPRTLYRIHHC